MWTILGKAGDGQNHGTKVWFAGRMFHVAYEEVIGDTKRMMVPSLNEELRYFEPERWNLMGGKLEVTPELKSKIFK